MNLLLFSKSGPYIYDAHKFNILINSLFMKLNVRLNWYELFNNLIKDFELNHIKKKQEEILY